MVVGGSGRMKVDDEIVELEQWDAVRVPPGTWRGYEAGPEGLEMLVIGAPNLGEDPREDVEGRRLTGGLTSSPRQASRRRAARSSRSRRNAPANATLDSASARSS